MYHLLHASWYHAFKSCLRRFLPFCHLVLRLYSGKRMIILLIDQICWLQANWLNDLWHSVITALNRKISLLSINSIGNILVHKCVILVKIRIFAHLVIMVLYKFNVLPHSFRWVIIIFYYARCRWHKILKTIISPEFFSLFFCRRILLQISLRNKIASVVICTMVDFVHCLWSVSVFASKFLSWALAAIQKTLHYWLVVCLVDRRQNDTWLFHLYCGIARF